jgi:hypothetical protein
VILGGNGTALATGQPLPFTASANTSPTRYNGQNASYTQFDAPDPKIYQWNLDVQHAIGTNTSVELAYVGSHGFNLNFPTDLNQLSDSQAAQNAAANGNLYNSLKPNRNFNSINGSTNDAISNYHSLQASINRRLARGVSFGFNYTWSHFLDDQDSSGWGSRAGPQDRVRATASSNYSNSNFDIRNAFKGNIVYEVPVGRGRMFLNHNAIIDEIFGGYQISSTMQFRSGNPFSVFANGVNTYAQNGTVTPFANYNGGSTTPRAGKSSVKWYDPTAFSTPAAGTFGNIRRNFLYGPGLELVNISAGKKFNLYEQVKLQIRVDATNAFNHVSLGQPSTNYTTAGTVLDPQIKGAQTAGRVLQGGFRFEF